MSEAETIRSQQPFTRLLEVDPGEPGLERSWTPC
jgi:hypothetical protein